MGTANERGITDVDINKEMREAYLQYSMSVIAGRALPDVRDGLKPVHRRALFAMNELSNTHDKPYKKSARVVGDVIGKYHPHGENAVYDTMVRMAQDFSLRYPLIDGQGNFGSIDGDSAAAPRYTEVRMTRLAEELLEDLEKETVPFGLNYDDSLLMPTVLPAKVPNLLVNGSSGIAVGMATNIPPHNLGEVVEACIQLIENPDITIDELINIVPGPDFPTAGVIAGTGGIISAYKKGRGVITIQAVAEIEEKAGREEIIVSELPYQVNKARLIENIANLVRDKKVEGISDIRDESSREGMRVVILIKKNDNANVILNRLFKYTQMQVSFGIILLALDARNQPQLFNLKSSLVAFIDHRKDVVTKRCIYELKKAQARAHLLEGLKKALDQIDAVIATIRESREASIARQNLIVKFEFSEAQAKAILEMRLQRLTGLEREKIDKELAELVEKINWLKSVLAESGEIYKIIKDELAYIKDKYADPRKTQITGSAADIEDEDLITEEDVVVTFTHTGYIKRIPSDQYKTQKRGGKGLKGMQTREEDFVTSIFATSTKTTLLCLTDKGKAYWVKVHRLPLGSRTSKGKAIANVIQVGNGEKVLAILPIKNFDKDRCIVMVTKNGIIKKTSLEAYAKPRPSGIIALTTDLDDQVIGARLTSAGDDIYVATSKGMSIRFNESDARAMGRTARGVKAITLGKGDEVVGVEIIPKGASSTILMITEGGYGKRTNVDEYRVQSRGGVGIITQKTTDKVGKLVGVRTVTDDDDLVLITNGGQVIRTKCCEISAMGRNTQGVKVINIKDELVSGMAIISEEQSAEIEH